MKINSGLGNEGSWNLGFIALDIRIEENNEFFRVWMVEIGILVPDCLEKHLMSFCDIVEGASEYDVEDNIEIANRIRYMEFICEVLY